MKGLIFFRTGWMHSYCGTRGDSITGGGAYVKKRKYGGEILNFKAHRGKYYGYVKSMGWSINLTRLGAEGKNHIDGVTVVWVATHPKGGMRIVGWYKNARLYADPRIPTGKHRVRKEDGQNLWYITRADVRDSLLLPLDERVFPIPRAKKGKSGFGQSNVWYADSTADQQCCASVRKYLRTRRLPAHTRTTQKPGSRRVDTHKRREVELNAVREVIRYFHENDYDVRDVSKDNVGWDLQAGRGRQLLRLEVKGLSGCDVAVELTPNEYGMSNRYRDSYRICVVTNALRKQPVLHVFAWSPWSACWEDAAGNALHVEERVAARAWV